MSGSGISWAICKSAPRSRQITTPAPHHSVFYRPDALPAAQPTASKHWRQKANKKPDNADITYTHINRTFSSQIIFNLILFYFAQNHTGITSSNNLHWVRLQSTDNWPIVGKNVKKIIHITEQKSYEKNGAKGRFSNVLKQRRRNSKLN